MRDTKGRGNGTRGARNRNHARKRAMIGTILDRLARVLELVLAFAFMVAVLLNFTNVVGRYLFGLSLLGSDEVQVFIMVAMTFLGAVVVTRRDEHLRMDVLAQRAPEGVRLVLRI